MTAVNRKGEWLAFHPTINNKEIYMNDTFVTGSAGLQWPASRVEIRTAGLSDRVNGMLIYIVNTDVDKECLRLSAAMPDAEIKVMQAARIRAVYKGGVRIKTRSMRDFYDMTEEEYKSYDLNNSLYMRGGDLSDQFTF
jgi:hypothetical protein